MNAPTERYRGRGPHIGSEAAMLPIGLPWRWQAKLNAKR